MYHLMLTVTWLSTTLKCPVSCFIQHVKKQQKNSSFSFWTWIIKAVSDSTPQ